MEAKPVVSTGYGRSIAAAAAPWRRGGDTGATAAVTTQAVFQNCIFASVAIQKHIGESA